MLIMMIRIAVKIWSLMIINDHSGMGNDKPIQKLQITASSSTRKVQSTAVTVLDVELWPLMVIEQRAILLSSTNSQLLPVKKRPALIPAFHIFQRPLMVIVQWRSALSIKKLAITGSSSTVRGDACSCALDNGR